MTAVIAAGRGAHELVGDRAARQPIKAGSEFDTVRIGMTAGDPLRGRGSFAKLYSLKVRREPHRASRHQVALRQAARDAE